MKITPIRDIEEPINNHILARKRYNDSIIHVSSGPKSRCIRIDIDADIEALGCAAYVLMRRYQDALKSYINRELVPENTDELIKQQVDDYFGCRRTGITMIRKENNNG